MWIVFGVLFLAFFGLVTQYLWNWLVPSLFGGPVIQFWQALGLLVLSKILFSGFGHKCHHHGHGVHWKQKLHQKFSAMTPEEREAFKRRMRNKWCSPREEDVRQSDVPPGSAQP